MGRLDDIAKRNRDASMGDPLAAKLLADTGGKPAEPDKPFTLPSQRKSGVSPWKVILLMLVIGAVVGVYTCRNMQRERDWEQAHGR